MTNSLSSEKYLKFSNVINIEESIKILNPLSKDLAILKQSMLFTGLETSDII